MTDIEGNVFIIFGDSARSDGSNIWGVYTTYILANESLEYFSQVRPDIEFHVEDFYLWGYQ